MSTHEIPWAKDVMAKWPVPITRIETKDEKGNVVSISETHDPEAFRAAYPEGFPNQMRLL